MDIDTPDESNARLDGIRENGVLRLVSAYESGEGLPYAPVNWPNQGDIWKWKVGKRSSISGFWLDRFLYPPDSLQKSPRKKQFFRSKLSVEQYIRAEFPNADVDAFFASFSWKVPSDACTRVKDRRHGPTFSRIPPKEAMSESNTQFKRRTMECKAGNKICNLQLQARSYSLEAMDCNVCCSEPGFCRDCCCILCCKTVDWAYGGYSFIRCDAKVSNNYICGHVAHIDCALRSKMAGTVRESIELDAEYYCRRCDNRTDLVLHVTRLIQTCESLEPQDDVEKILNVGTSILRSSRRISAKTLLNRIELAMTKLNGGVFLEGDNVSAASTGELFHLPNNATLMGLLEVTNYKDSLNFENQSELAFELDYVLRRSQEPPNITSNHHQIVQFENEIDSVLIALRKSQESEYRIAEEKLCAQKNLLHSLSQQLDMKRSELVKPALSNNGCGFDNQLDPSLDIVNQIQKEVEKLKDMEEVAKGFGRAPKGILKEHFDFKIED